MIDKIGKYKMTNAEKYIPTINLLIDDTWQDYKDAIAKASEANKSIEEYRLTCDHRKPNGELALRPNRLCQYCDVWISTAVG